MDMLGTGSNILLIVLGFGLLIAVARARPLHRRPLGRHPGDGFAIGMGPVVASYRGGVGFRLGSCDEVVKDEDRQAADPVERPRARGTGLGETEYSSASCRSAAS